MKTLHRPLTRSAQAYWACTDCGRVTYDDSVSDETLEAECVTCALICDLRDQLRKLELELCCEDTEPILITGGTA